MVRSTHVCERCDREFTSAYTLRRHSERIYGCTRGIQVDQRTGVTLADGTVLTKKQCEICLKFIVAKWFDRYFLIKFRHMRVHNQKIQKIGMQEFNFKITKWNETFFLQGSKVMNCNKCGHICKPDAMRYLKY